MAQTLDYLIFDYSEDEEGTATWDAMASVPAHRVTALVDEVTGLLRWAHRDFPGRRGAIEDGSDWDFDLQAQDDAGDALPAHFDTASGQLHLRAGAGHTTVSLSISGNSAFADAFTRQFQWED